MFRNLSQLHYNVTRDVTMKMANELWLAQTMYLLLRNRLVEKMANENKNKAGNNF